MPSLVSISPSPRLSIGRDKFAQHSAMFKKDKKERKYCVKDFETLGILGRGAYGEVRLVRKKRHVSGKMFKTMLLCHEDHEQG